MGSVPIVVVKRSSRKHVIVARVGNDPPSRAPDSGPYRRLVTKLYAEQRAMIARLGVDRM